MPAFTFGRLGQGEDHASNVFVRRHSEQGNVAVTVSERAAWPDDWTERVAGKDCALCVRIGEPSQLRVAEGECTVVYLQRRTLLPGYCEVVWKRGHVAEPGDLPHDHQAAYWREVVQVGRAIQKVFRPIKMNYLTLGNWVPHLHTHVVPRYPDDPAPGGPIGWDAMFGGPVPEEILDRWATELRKALGW